MDRRDALKKLGVGGAVAVSAPILLDSFNVASASSHTLLDDVVLAVGNTASWLAGSAAVPAPVTYSLTFNAPTNDVSILAEYAYSVTANTLSSFDGSSTTVTRPVNQRLLTFTLTIVVTWTREAETVSATYAFDYKASGNSNNFVLDPPRVVAVPA
jgi:hypothetical protein